MSFTPKQIGAAITIHYPEIKLSYAPDFRQKIADSWPASIDDSSARADWGWTNDFDMTTMTEAMFKNLKEQVYTH